jgi:hypothetical protein
MIAIHFGLGDIQPEVWVGGVLVIVGMYTGTVSLEDGLTRLAEALILRMKDKDAS